MASNKKECRESEKVLSGTRFVVFKAKISRKSENKTESLNGKS